MSFAPSMQVCVCRAICKCCGRKRLPHGSENSSVQNRAVTEIYDVFAHAAQNSRAILRVLQNVRFVVEVATFPYLQVSRFPRVIQTELG